MLSISCGVFLSLVVITISIKKYLQTEVEVYRKDSRKLPIGDPELDWEETVYLNLIIHQFDYTLTLAICTRTSPKQLQVLRRHSQVQFVLRNY